MPIFAYLCDSCGFEKDVLQKRSDPPLTACPSCGKETFARRLTAPAFQLKGSGWYATDFRDNGKAKAKPDAKDGAAPADGQAAQSGTNAAGGDAPSTAKASSSAESAASSSASPAPATPAAPAPGKKVA
jgi:putative FmdB family regulatory protein